MLTPRFGKTKGEAELALLALAKTTPSLNPFSVRPGMVDSVHHPEVIAAQMSRKEGIPISTFKTVAAPAIRALFSSSVSPTPELGKFTVDLALSNGAILERTDVEEGRIISNKAIRRMAKEGQLDR